jgi:hypothetical protein
VVRSALDRNIRTKPGNASAGSESRKSSAVACERADNRQRPGPSLVVDGKVVMVFRALSAWGHQARPWSNLAGTAGPARPTPAAWATDTYVEFVALTPRFPSTPYVSSES